MKQRCGFNTYEENINQIRINGDESTDKPEQCTDKLESDYNNLTGICTKSPPPPEKSVQCPDDPLTQQNIYLELLPDEEIEEPRLGAESITFNSPQAQHNPGSVQAVALEQRMQSLEESDSLSQHNVYLELLPDEANVDAKLDSKEQIHGMQDEKRLNVENIILFSPLASDSLQVVPREHSVGYSYAYDHVPQNQSVTDCYEEEPDVVNPYAIVGARLMKCENEDLVVEENDAYN